MAGYESNNRWCGYVRLDYCQWHNVCTFDTYEEVERSLAKHYSTRYFEAGEDASLISNRRETVILRSGVEPIGQAKRGRTA